VVLQRALATASQKPRPTATTSQRNFQRLAGKRHESGNKFAAVDQDPAPPCRVHGNICGPTVCDWELAKPKAGLEALTHTQAANPKRPRHALRAVFSVVQKMSND